MTIAITHPFVSAKGDGTDATLVRPSNWNATHSTSMQTLNLIGRLTAGVGAFEEIAITALLAAALNSADGNSFLAAIGAGGFFTGDVKARYGVGAVAGYVRLNGRGIGSATSGAPERANADTQALFQYLWDTDPNLAVSTGRGVSSIADWNANKVIALPDFRGRAVTGLDGMGASLAGRLTGSWSTGAPDTLGAAGGFESQTLTVGQMPSHSHSISDPGHTHAITLIGGTGNNTSISAGGGAGSEPPAATGTGFTGISIVASGGGASHPIMQPFMLLTLYMKL